MMVIHLNFYDGRGCNNHFWLHQWDATVHSILVAVVGYDGPLQSLKAVVGYDGPLQFWWQWWDTSIHYDFGGSGRI